MPFPLLSLTALFVLQSVTSFALPSDDHGWQKPIAAAYYTGWHATDGFPLSAVSWSKYDTLIYAFA